eukprot:TRINITY_DN108472_c0_g1_i1.p1 TRINITY_DN108472_c0_g1~~TRINITY_DN108472_c0_g1_i1.p1  ORF type:complete len:460 (+),score=86.98 TRINITY_DN108472_c0_g1_i1:92-1471(+)
MALDVDCQDVIELAHAFLEGEEFLPGSKLSAILSESAAPQVETAKLSLGGKNGKGWLKALLASDPRIQFVQIPGVDEPCYSVTGSSVTIKQQRQVSRAQPPLAKPPVGRPPAHLLQAPPAPHGSKVFKPTKFGQSLQPAVPLPRRLPNLVQPLKLGQAMQKATPAHWKLMQSSPQPRQEPAMELELPEDAYELIALAQDLLQAEEYLPGSRLSKHLQEHSASQVESTKAALGGKGWLKKLFACVPGIELVQIEGVDEPCFSIVGSTTHPKQQRQPVAHAAVRLPARLPLRPPAWPPEGQDAAQLMHTRLPSHPQGKGKHAQGKGKHANFERGVLGKRKLDQAAVSVQSVKQPRVSTKMTGIPATFPSEEADAICSAAIQTLSEHMERGFVEGSKLSKSVRELVPSSVEALMQAIEGEFGRDRDGRLGKGWLKLILAESPMISQVTVEGLDEPCFAIAGS